MNTSDNRGIHSLVMAVALSIGLGFATHASARSYLIDLKTKTATDLGNVQATAINDAGQVAGNSGSHAFITGSNGVGMTDLGTLPGGDTSSASGINNAGQVVGWSLKASNDMRAFTIDDTRAFITGPNGMGMSDLGTLGGIHSSASAINDAGQVVGWSNTTEGTQHAFITGRDGVGMTDFDTRDEDVSFANGINNAGQVVGEAGMDGYQSHAFITDPNGMSMTDLGTIGGARSAASDINDLGQVAGWSYSANGTHAFITGPNGVGMRDLGTLGGIRSSASGVNDAGQVVGWSNTTDGTQHAFISGPSGVGMTDLNSLVHLPGGLMMNEAVAINNMGQVIVSAIREPES